MKEKTPLTDQELKKVAGGYIYNNKNDEKNRWSVVDDKGNFHESFDNYKAAMKSAAENNWSVWVINDEELQELRETGHVDM